MGEMVDSVQLIAVMSVAIALIATGHWVWGGILGSLMVFAEYKPAVVKKT